MNTWTIISANVFDYMLHIATTVLHEYSIKKKSDNLEMPSENSSQSEMKFSESTKIRLKSNYQDEDGGNRRLPPLSDYPTPLVLGSN